MSRCTFIALDYPLQTVAPSHDYPGVINIDKGTIYDGDTDDNFYLHRFEDVQSYTDMMFSYSNVLEKNWGISIPLKSKYKEIYQKDSGASFNGDGIRYHIFSYEYEDYIDLMFAWDGTDNDKTIFHSSYREAVNECLKEIDVPEEYYPNYDNCSFKYKSQKDNSELTILWDNEKKERESRRKIDGSVQAMQEFAKWYEKDK